jgi:hypothetical protein
MSQSWSFAAALVVMKLDWLLNDPELVEGEFSNHQCRIKYYENI